MKLLPSKLKDYSTSIELNYASEVSIFGYRIKKKKKKKEEEEEERFVA